MILPGFRFFSRATGVLVVGALCCVARAQLEEIDQSKLPESPTVHAAYLEALTVERYAQSWNAKWPYEIPKAQVVNSLKESLTALNQAHQGNPDNYELDLLAGLVAHFAYNVDVENAYQPAYDLLAAAVKQWPEDIRGSWFFGIHECQSLKVDEGMQMLLALEVSGKTLPEAFWDDYVTCATVAMMPAHTLRGIDRAIADGENGARFDRLRQIAESRYKTADLSMSIGSREAWNARPEEDADVFFYSALCGIGLRSKTDWAVQIPDVQHGTCTLMIQPPAGALPHTGATILLMARPAQPAQSPEDMVRGVMAKDGAVVTQSQNIACEIPGCVAMEATNGKMYDDQGGARIYAVAFRRAEPQYDGLIFEEPFEPKPPKNGGGGGNVVYRPVAVFRRLPGTVDYIVVLDASANIYEKAKAQYDFVLKSLQVE